MLLALDNDKILKAIRNLRRLNTELTIEFAANVAKEYYDSRYILVKLNVNDMVYLKLYKGYYLLKKLNRKILKQRTGLFYIKKRVEKLIYKLKLFS